ncbi:MAG: isoprenyl transferase, partial [Bacilli bacterium]|nr:isoprenyl transferase [Bacilli bacterium]
GLPRVAGHRAGMKTVKEITTAADDAGVSVLTLYAFSTENWKRPTYEVKFLMELAVEFIGLELAELNRKNVRIQIIGDESALPDITRRAITEAVIKTQANTGMTLNIALNYGSRTEMTEAVRKIASEVAEGKLNPADISEELFSEHLLTSQLPDPDLLIRTSGEIRLSNFLLWQLAYTELWFTDVYWPDFTRELFFQALSDYKGRGRRFGGLL